MPKYLLFLLVAVPVWPQTPAPEHSEAEWVIRKGGRVRIDGAPQYMADLPSLPARDFRITSVDLTGAEVEPEELSHLSALSELQELFLPAQMWNPGAGSNRNANADLAKLAPLKKLRLLQVSVHFLTNISIDDTGLDKIAGLTQIEELRLAQSRVKGKGLAPFTNLQA